MPPIETSTAEAAIMALAGPVISAPVPVPANVRYFDTPFVGDIAHNAEPTGDTDNNPSTPPVALRPDDDNVASADFASQPAGTYDDEMLNAHFCAGEVGPAQPGADNIYRTVRPEGRIGEIGLGEIDIG